MSTMSTPTNPKPDPKKEVAPAPTHGNREFPRQADAVKAGPTTSLHDRIVKDTGEEPVDPSTFNVKGFAQRDMASQQPVDQPRDLNEKKA
jgi:hypothetical protein